MYGWSLGSAFAVDLASQVQPAAVIREGAPASIVAIGQQRYPMFPVRLLIRNPFESIRKIDRVKSPIATLSDNGIRRAVRGISWSPSARLNSALEGVAPVAKSTGAWNEICVPAGPSEPPARAGTTGPASTMAIAKAPIGPRLLMATAPRP